MSSPSPQESNLRRPHPLAAALVERLREHPHARVLEVGTGSGRNTAAMTAAGLSVHSVSDDRVRAFDAEYGFDAALSTHALLHGTPDDIASILRTVSRLLKPGAPLFATFGSWADARYGRGTQIDRYTFAPHEGEEIGVPHAFFGEADLRRMLERDFSVESLEERSVDEVVGRWAHARQPKGSVHWFARASRR